MSSILWKSFNLCFSKFKCLPTVKFADHESLYFQKSLATTSTPSSVVEDFFSSSSATGDFDTDYIPNFASQRFFFSTPGCSNSNSIFEPMIVEVPGTFLSGGVAVHKYSPDPYAEFHKSTQEMIESHELISDGESSWEFLHELLCCYLTLNPKHIHRFIVDASANVILSLVTPPGTCRKAHSRQHFTAPPAFA